MGCAFLTAEWRYLAILNYGVDPALLAPYVPAGTELDDWHGHTYVSVVGFLFRNTRLLGLPIPFHRHFEEINLRFYVRREVGGELRRAVTFIKELVPRPAIAAVARLAYNEPYLAVPMRHWIAPTIPGGDAPAEVEYRWRVAGRWGRVAVVPTGASSLIKAGTEAEFIAEHYWGYTRQRDGGTVEYEVRHPRWRIWNTERAVLEGDLEALYGPVFAGVLEGGPSSAFFADGSLISVYMPRRLPGFPHAATRQAARN